VPDLKKIALHIDVQVRRAIVEQDADSLRRLGARLRFESLTAAALPLRRDAALRFELPQSSTNGIVGNAEFTGKLPNTGKPFPPTSGGKILPKMSSRLFSDG
jgi:hypothetical protein